MHPRDSKGSSSLVVATSAAAIEILETLMSIAQGQDILEVLEVVF